jgi:hypothetical protein
LVGEREQDKYLAVLIVLTILVPYHVGFEDVLWFLWRGEFQAESVVWTWCFLNNIFPPWTTSKHLLFWAAGMIGLGACWALFLAKRWIKFSFNYFRGYHPKRKRKLF